MERGSLSCENKKVESNGNKFVRLSVIQIEKLEWFWLKVAANLVTEG
ncbi:hypothetical protein CFREI_12615 [Corynebacterium freiburgense]|nr:hypothetical protein CFREI_12615 [Corynebacterium freiburgense]